MRNFCTRLMPMGRSVLLRSPSSCSRGRRPVSLLYLRPRRMGECTSCASSCASGSRRNVRSSSELAHSAGSGNVETFGRGVAGMSLSGRRDWKPGFVVFVFVVEKRSIKGCVKSSHYRAFRVVLFVSGFAFARRRHTEAKAAPVDVETLRS